MVKSNGFCKYAKNITTVERYGCKITQGNECEKGYKKCTGQGCKCFEGNEKWVEYLRKRDEYKKQFL